MERTSFAAKASYAIEGFRFLENAKKARINIIENYLKILVLQKKFPENLIYKEDFYDTKTGSSATLFYDTQKEDYILAYTGTNLYTDIERDVYTDIYSIAMGQGAHYSACINFYKKVLAKYSSNITLTGHSLGGNIAMRVALEFNTKKTIVYNSAPLYLKNGVDLFMDKEENEALYLKRIRKCNRNVSKIKILEQNFIGEVLRITSEADFITRLSVLLDGYYIGDEVIIKNAGSHFMKYLLTKDVQKEITKIIENKKQQTEVDYLPIALNNFKILENVSDEKLITIEEKIKDFLKNNKLNKVLTSKIENINLEKFFTHLEKKLDDERKNNK